MQNTNLDSFVIREPFLPFMIKSLVEWILVNDEIPQLIIDTSVTGIDMPVYLYDNPTIAFNVDPVSCNNLSIEKDYISFDASFTGKLHSVYIPTKAVYGVQVDGTTMRVGFENFYYMGYKKNDHLKPEIATSETIKQDKKIDEESKKRSNNIVYFKK